MPKYGYMWYYEYSDFLGFVKMHYGNANDCPGVNS